MGPTSTQKFLIFPAESFQCLEFLQPFLLLLPPPKFNSGLIRHLPPPKKKEKRGGKEMWPNHHCFGMCVCVKEGEREEGSLLPSNIGGTISFLSLNFQWQVSTLFLCLLLIWERLYNCLSFFLLLVLIFFVASSPAHDLRQSPIWEETKKKIKCTFS